MPGASENNSVRVLCVDDEWVVRAGMRHLLGQKTEFAVTGAGSVDEALAAIADEPRFDLIILDLKMPGTERLAGLKALRERAPTVPVLVFSVYDSRADVLAAIEAGAMGYITKATPGDEIFAVIERVLAGEVWVPRSLMVARDSAGSGDGAAGLRAADIGVSQERATRALTKRQQEILDYLAVGLSNRQIAHEIGISEHTVRVHMTAILRALGVHNRTQAAVLAASWQGVAQAS